MITKEQALELLSSIADNPPRVCVAWCGKAEDDCACFKAYVAREAVNGQAEDALQTVIALHEWVERAREGLQNIIDSYEATSELHTSSAECAANLYDFAMTTLKEIVG